MCESTRGTWRSNVALKRGSQTWLPNVALQDPNPASNARQPPPPHLYTHLDKGSIRQVRLAVSNLIVCSPHPALLPACLRLPRPVTPVHPGVERPPCRRACALGGSSFIVALVPPGCPKCRRIQQRIQATNSGNESTVHGQGLPARERAACAATCASSSSMSCSSCCSCKSCCIRSSARSLSRLLASSSASSSSSTSSTAPLAPSPPSPRPFFPFLLVVASPTRPLRRSRESRVTRRLYCRTRGSRDCTSLTRFLTCAEYGSVWGVV